MEVCKKSSKLGFEFRSGMIKEIFPKENDHKNGNVYHLLSACNGHLAIRSILITELSF